MNGYLCIVALFDPPGNEHLHRYRVAADTPRDAAVRVIEPIHLQDGWSVRSVEVYPDADPVRFVVHAQADWLVGQELER